MLNKAWPNSTSGDSLRGLSSHREDQPNKFGYGQRRYQMLMTPLSTELAARLERVSKISAATCPHCDLPSMVPNSKVHQGLICVVCTHRMEESPACKYAHLIRLRRFYAQILDMEEADKLTCTHPDCRQSLLTYPEERLWTHNAGCTCCGQLYSVKPLLKEQMAQDEKQRRLSLN